MSERRNGPAIVMPGATGRLRPVAQELLERGHRLRILTRTPDSSAARALAALGADVAFGDFDDVESLARGARGADVLVSGGTAHRTGPDGELRHGLNVAEAAVAAGVGQLVYLSGAGANQGSGIPVFESKLRVEERVRSLPVASTILAPAYFMENLFNPWNLPSLRAGRYPSPVGADTVVQQVAIADIARFVALVVERAHDLAGERIELASDALSGREAARIASRAIGRRLAFQNVLRDGVVTGGPMTFFDWLEREGTRVDVRMLHRRFPQIGWLSFEQWATRQSWAAVLNGDTPD
jgi:uncharacterized protein YbjT (DUF2867 family)